MNSKYQPCPRCESKKTYKITKAFRVFLGISLIGFGIWLLIIPPLGILFILIGAAYAIAALFFPAKFKCKECQYSWKYNPSTE